ncbi:glycerophosphodiester phosphodiesterase [Bacillus weihaiensis]|uniref:glycerophosphodiester phosphodiesterase n=1 Tax=Bacillus weihaiensis TaxID=1547283 RepID=UPI0009FB78F0|nr:glycerophosphodiester phosphodiesterase family protein [Bacillus weihaiensis]
MRSNYLSRITTMILQLKKILTKRFSHFQDYVIIAHRGASGYTPENTFAAFDKAIELGADYLELDVQLAKDEEVVVIHDAKVDRTSNGKGHIHHFTLKELQKLEAGSWFHEDFYGERIPTLTQVLQRYGGKIGMLIEVKYPSLYPTIAEKLAKLLTEEMYHNQTIIVQSFDFQFLKQFHQHAPSIPLGLLVKYSIKGITNNQLKEWSSLVSYINPNKALVTKTLVKKIHYRNMKTFPYTARDRKGMEKLIHNRVDGIITDFPDLTKKDPSIESSP